MVDPILKEELKRSEYATLSPEAILAKGDQITETIEKTETYSWSGVYRVCGENGLAETVVDSVIDSLPNGKSIDRALSSKGGFDLSDPINRAKIQSILDANISPDHNKVAQILLDVPVTKKTRWETIGIQRPTTQDIAEAINENTMDKLKVDSQQIMDSAWNKLLAGDKAGASADIHALADTWGA